MTPPPTLLRAILVVVTTLVLTLFGGPSGAEAAACDPAGTPSHAQQRAMKNPCPGNSDAAHNPYAYANNNPLTASDPTGLMSLDGTGAAMRVTIGGSASAPGAGGSGAAAAASSGAAGLAGGGATLMLGGPETTEFGDFVRGTVMAAQDNILAEAFEDEVSSAIQYAAAAAEAATNGGQPPRKPPNRSNLGGIDDGDGEDDPAANGVSETAGGLTNLGSTNSRLNLDEFSSGQGFSGVYDQATRSILALPSSRAAQLPANWVSARGGHAVVNARLSQALGTSSGGRSGFTAFLDNAGGLRVEWLSRSVNGAANPYVPTALRPSILQALSAATGRTAY